MKIASTEFYAAIPAPIRPLILECRILQSEDATAHRDLLIEFWKLYRPNTVMQWLDLKKLRDLIWEGLRLGRIKPEIIKSGRKRALSSLLLSMTNERERDLTPSGNMMQSEQRAVDWFLDQHAKKEIKALLDKFEFSESTIDAVAFTQHTVEMETVEKMQNWSEARLFAVRRQIEEEREFLELQADAGIEGGLAVRQRLPVGANSNEEKDQCEPVQEQEEAPDDGRHAGEGRASRRCGTRAR